MTEATLALVNGTVLTMDPAHPRARAIGIRDGRVVIVGDDAVVRTALAGAETVDLHGRTAVPGFIDAHLHLLRFGYSLRQVDLTGVRSITDAIKRVAQVATGLAPGAWVLGGGWRRNDLQEGRLPTAEDLDTVVLDRPVALHSHDLHSIWCNSRALALAGIEAASSDPPGARIMRDEHGRPTGVLQEQGVDLIQRHIPATTPDDDDRALRQAMAALNRCGVTSAGNMEGRPALRALQRLYADGALSLRVYQMIPSDDLAAALTLGVQTGLGDDWLRLGHVKIFSDGALGSRTAWMQAPYAGTTSNYGVPIHDLPVLRDLVEMAARAGIAPAIHAIGDRANHEVLRIFAAGRAEGWLSPALRPRIEHVQVLLPEDLGELARLGVVASMQPVHCTADMTAVDTYWGERGRYAYAWRSLLDHGTRLAFGSDAPVEAPDVIAGLHAAATRQRADGTPDAGWHPAERITVEEALAAYTHGAAYAAGEEARKGRLRPGMVGDVAVLSADPTTQQGLDLLRVRIEMTVVGGRIVYAA